MRDVAGRLGTALQSVAGRCWPGRGEEGTQGEGAGVGVGVSGAAQSSSSNISLWCAALSPQTGSAGAMTSQRPPLMLFPAMAVLFLLCGVVLLSARPARAANQLPQDWSRCKKTDPNLNSCLESAVQEAVSKMGDGIPSLGVPSIDPLELSAIEIGQGQGPISVNQKFTNVKVLGLSKAKLEKSRANLEQYILSLDGSVTNDFEADYEMDGRILVLPVTGKGRCKLSFTNMKATLEPKGKETIKNGKKYFDITQFDINIRSLDKMEVHFDNLFNGDKALGDTMNALMNENWKDLWGELKPAFEQTFSAVFLQISKRIFDKVAFDDVFLD